MSSDLSLVVNYKIAHQKTVSEFKEQWQRRSDYMREMLAIAKEYGFESAAYLDYWATGLIFTAFINTQDADYDKEKWKKIKHSRFYEYKPKKTNTRFYNEVMARVAELEKRKFSYNDILRLLSKNQLKSVQDLFLLNDCIYFKSSKVLNEPKFLIEITASEFMNAQHKNNN